MGPFTETKWVVCHGPGVVHFVDLNPGSIMETGQPYCEGFATKKDAIARATTLGYFIPAEDELTT